MKGVGRDQSWVTMALNDTAAWQALVLARSLKRTFTTRKLTVLIADEVSHPLRYILRKEFDLIVRIETSDLLPINNNGAASTLGLSKCWCWNLTVWDKCVFIDANSLVIRNADDIFNYEEFSAPPCYQAPERFSTSLFCFQPNSETFERIMDLASQLNSAKEDDVLNSYFSTWKDSAQKQINSTFSMMADLTDMTKKIPPCIVRFSALPWMPSFETERKPKLQNFANQWLTTFSQDVIVLLNQIKKRDIVEMLEESISTNHLPPRNGPPKPFKDLTLTELQNTIVVVGMSCRFPGANNIDEFWNLLVDGVDAIKDFPAERPRGHRPGFDRNDRQQLMAGFLKCPVDEFDAKFFGISPREAPFVDPQQRVLLEVTWESLENAGINPQALRNTDTGVFMGIWQQDYDHMLPGTGDANDFHHRYLGNAFSATASRISYFLGLNGPNLALESGCSSSFGALHVACESLRRGETSIAISSGVNLVLNASNPLSGSNDAAVLSKDHRCKTFDESADGFVRAEGCGVLILKRYSDAIRDGDNIQALIRGSALNNDGAGSSFGTPNAKAQERVIKEALRNANVDPLSVSYVEAHGTGTAVGDPTEIYALSQAYSGNRASPLIVSSVKTNIGHTESCAGMAGIIKVILCLKNQQIPAHLHLKSLNPRIDLEAIPATIPLALTEWKGTERIAAVSSFSMSGTNVHMLVQEPPTLPSGIRKETLEPQIITISAKSEAALEALIGKYIDFLHQNPKANLVDIAYATNMCRANLSNRIAAVAKDIPQLLSKLEKRTFITGKVPAQKSKVAFLFTGQGSQYTGMAKNLYENFSEFRNAFDRTGVLFNNHLGVSLQKVVWEDPKLLEETIYCQPAIFCVQYALTQLWAAFGIRPDYVLGHSVGEFGAAVCSGIISLEHAMKLVVERSRLVNNLPSGSMMALKTSVDRVKTSIDTFKLKDIGSSIDIAAVNSPSEVVVSGKPNTIQMFREFCENNGIKSQIIPASHAFHSKEMDAVLTEFGEVATTITYSKENCIYVSGTLAEPVGFDNFGPHYWQRHLRNTVMFSEAIKQVWNECKVLVEIGAQPTLLGLTMANVSDASLGSFCPSLRKTEEDWVCVLNTLSKLYVAGIDIDWKQWFGIRTKNVMLPMYPFQRQKYWYVIEETTNTDGVRLNSKLLHPLLGRKLPAPVTDNIFCNSLNIKDLPYLEDHKVAERVIVPAAAYLECILAAGRDVLQGGSIQVSLTVENLSVEAALEIETYCHIQTIVSSSNLEDGIQYKISIHRQVSPDQPDKWKRHAHSTFSPTTRCISKILDLDELKSRMNVKDSVAEAYSAIANVGIQFGPKFQSIQKAWSGSNELLTQITLPDDSPEYLCHPIVLDAMIQTYAFRFALSSTTLQKDLQLPVKIRKFVWFSVPSTKQVFAHTVWDKNEGNVNLYNELGEQLASMEGLELIQTTVDSFLRVLRADHSELPDFWQEVWRPSQGTTTSRINTDLITSEVNSELTYQSKFAIEIEAANKKEWLAYKKLNGMFVYFISRTFQECDWEFRVGSTIDIEILRSTLSHSLRGLKLLESCLEMLTLEGYLKNSTMVLKSLPSIEKCGTAIEGLAREVIQILGVDDPVYQFVKRIGLNYTNVFQGKMTPLELLFPSDPTEYGAQRFYGEGRWYQLNGQQLIALFLDTISPLAGKGKGILRILEVGAGTGAATAELLNGLNTIGVSYDYTFTDLSPMLISEAGKRLGDKLTYGILNIEEDPLSQGFAPEQYDVIIAMQVIHATTHLNQSLSNLRKLLRKGGIICLAEQFVPTYTLSFTFGLLDGWWRFQDNRTMSPIVDAAGWKNCLNNSGFENVSSIDMFEGTGGVVIAKNTGVMQATLPNGKSWVIFDDESDLCQNLALKLQYYGRTVIMVKLNHEAEFKHEDDRAVLRPENASHFKQLFAILSEKKLEGLIYMWTNNENESVEVSKVQESKCGGLLHLCQALIKLSGEYKVKPKLFTVTRGLHYLGDSAPGNPDGATAWGLLKSFSNEHPEIPTFLIDTDHNEPDSEIEVQEVFTHLWRKSKEMFVKLSDGKKYVQRLAPLDKTKPKINLPASTRYQFIIPASGSFADIEIGPASKAEVTGNNIEISVQATALNFRDLFMVLRPEGFKVPEDQPIEVGLDVAGIVSAIGPDVTTLKLGDEVFGFTLFGGIRSHIIVPDFSVMKKPKEMTFAGAATIPCAFLTAYYSLVVCAKICSSDRVLIHVASGGVGLAAIQIANHFGAEIFATAGSKRKRSYLKTLGIKYIYHSRNTSYGECIENDTEGAGVTIVLNSLTGPGFKETSLAACAKGAQFVEIGKLNIWNEDEVKVLRPDMKYYIVDLSEMGIRAPKEAAGMMKEMEKSFESGLYTSLPHTTFPLDLTRHAFYYFQEAKHIGKVVIQMPKPQISPEGRLSLKHDLFNHQSTYLITGGLGGLGMEVAKWMTTLGAQSIVLVGRSPPTAKVQELINELNVNGSNIFVIQANVGKHEECAALLESMKELGLPPLRGIMHAAGLISDGIVPNQSWEKYNCTLEPKAFGAWNLHRLTLNYDMEFFVMFSSLASIVGLPAQSNHCAGNRYLDSLAHYRISLGLQATTVNWGPWSDVGAAAHIKLGQEGALGLRAFTPRQGIRALEQILQQRINQTVVLDVSDWNLVKQFIFLGNYLSEIKSNQENKNANVDQYSNFAEEINRAAPEERQAKVQSYLEAILKQTLRLPDNERIDPEQNFTELGVDSLMAMEMRNRLQGVIGDKTLSVSALQENRTLRSLSTHMASLLNSEKEETVQLTDTIVQDSKLPPNISVSEIKPLQPSQFKEVLLTGATGHLGSHLLLELNKVDLTVHCLVRGSTREEATQKLLNTLSKYCVLDQVDMSKVQVVVGDVSAHQLGLGDEYERLADTVDAIVHSAIKGNHLESYNDGGENSMRKHNVLGLINIISMASSGKTKPILHASSILAVNKLSAEGHLSEEYPDEQDYGESITNGYSLSKYVCEKLLLQASERGIPVTVLRYPSIFGNSETGFMPIEYNHAWNLLLSCIRVGMFPQLDHNGLPIMPVDVAAKISVQLFLDDLSETGVYNLLSDEEATEDVIKEVVSEFDVDGKFVPFSEWRKAVFENSDANLLSPLAFMYEDEKDAPRYLSFHPMARSMNHIKFSILSSKLLKNLPDVKNILVPAKTVLRRHLQCHFNLSPV